MLDLKTLMNAEIENVMLVPQDPDLRFTPAIVPVLQENMFTYQACRDWESVLYAEVARISVQDVEYGKSGLLVELYTEEPEMLMAFGNLCAGNCTREQARLWLHNPNFHVNGYEWDYPAPSDDVAKAVEYIVGEGLKNTAEGNWTVDFEDVKKATGLAISKDSGFGMAVLSALGQHEAVADIGMTERGFDACFHLDYCQNLELSDEEIGQVMQ